MEFLEPLAADDPHSCGDFRLLGRLGSGGMGRVYLGHSVGGRTVAVKTVRPELAEDSEFRSRFRQEVAAARRVGSEWTAPVLGAETEGPRPWLATGYVAGPPLDAAVRDVGPLPEESVRALGVGLAQALIGIHGADVVHRDVKPSNVLLTLDGPRLVDFGIARALDSTSALTQTGYVMGSPAFLPPERALGEEAGTPADVFALAAVLAFAATGRGPFGEAGGSSAVLYRVVHEQPDLTGVPDPLRPLIERCLSKDPAARPTPGVLRDALAGSRSTAQFFAQAWLPTELVSAIARRSAALLDLEPDRTAASAAEAAATAVAAAAAEAVAEAEAVATAEAEAEVAAAVAVAGPMRGHPAKTPSDRPPLVPAVAAARPARRRHVLAWSTALLAFGAAVGCAAWLLSGPSTTTSASGKVYPPGTYTYTVSSQESWTVTLSHESDSSASVEVTHVFGGASCEAVAYTGYIANGDQGVVNLYPVDNPNAPLIQNPYGCQVVLLLLDSDQSGDLTATTSDNFTVVPLTRSGT